MPEPAATCCKQKVSLGLEWQSPMKKLNENHWMHSCHEEHLAAVSGFDCWGLRAPLGKPSLLYKVAEPPWGPQPQPGKPQPCTKGTQLCTCPVTQPRRRETMSPMLHAWGTLTWAPDLWTATFDSGTEHSMHLLQASWRRTNIFLK